MKQQQRKKKGKKERLDWKKKIGIKKLSFSHDLTGCRVEGQTSYFFFFCKLKKKKRKQFFYGIT